MRTVTMKNNNNDIEKLKNDNNDDKHWRQGTAMHNNIYDETFIVIHC